MRANRWEIALLGQQATIRQAFENLNSTGLQVVLCVNEQRNLIGILTDGDLRRGVLSGLSLDHTIGPLINKSPVTVLPAVPPQKVAILMRSRSLRHVPIIDEFGVLVGLHLDESWQHRLIQQNIMVVMAGGFGKRMRPYTLDKPKPLLEVGGKPILAHIIERAVEQGFVEIHISVNYLADQIKSYFGDGSDFGISISYIHEDQPLGTAGALGLIANQIDSPFIVTNGDVITDIDYSDLLRMLEKENVGAAMAVKTHELVSPYGVVQIDGSEIMGISEKPSFRTTVNAGIYALTPFAVSLIEDNEAIDMPDLFERLRGSSKRVVAYPMYEQWLDVGRPADLDEARQLLNDY